MSHGTEHHLEEAEHAQHHAADPFNQRVAMTMAMIAAGLACLTMLSHQAHNDTLAGIMKASDTWGYYQAKKNRGYMYDALADLLGELSVEPQPSESGSDKDKKAGKVKRIEKWKTKAKEYEGDGEKIKEQAEGLEKGAERAHHMSARFDLGELGVELALVFCSLAVLTKRKPFWYSGITVGVVGFAVGMSAYLLH